MLWFFRHAGPAIDLKYRLFACGCCRRVWDRFPDDNNRALVAAVENHPDGTFDDPDIRDAAVAASAREWEFEGVPAYWVAKYLGRGFYKMSAAVSAAIVAAMVASLADEGYRVSAASRWPGTGSTRAGPATGPRSEGRGRCPRSRPCRRPAAARPWASASGAAGAAGPAPTGGR
jgi:hypothetical protein